ncbi:arylsulfatase B-like [Agrilus planipennis]|nr:arylsulfatase B-like [Agrilus planipennis]
MTYYTDANINGFDLRDNFRVAREYRGQYATELFTNKAIEFIKGHDTSVPMFLIVSHLAPHTGPDSKVEVKNLTETNEKFNYIRNQERRNYAGATEELDKSVGEILAALAEKSILNDTLILFLSDNGAPTVGQYANQGSNWPLRGIKMSYYEGGVRGTAVLWGSQLNKNVINNDLFHISDIMPTFYAAAGGHISDLGIIDGINQWDMISKNAPGTRTEMLVGINDRTRAAAYIDRKGQYKLFNGTSNYNSYYGEAGRLEENPEYNITEIFESKVHQTLKKVSDAALDDNMILQTRSQLDLSRCRIDSEKPNINCSSFCLFDLFNDPCEKIDIKDQQEDLVNEMKLKIEKYWEQVVPQPAKYIDPRSNPIYFNNTWDTWLNQFCLPNDSNPLCS